MKIQIRNNRPSYVFVEQAYGKNPGNRLELAIPHFKPKAGKDMFKNLLRWEEDGGPTFEISNSFPQVAEGQLSRFPVVDHDNKFAGMIAQDAMVMRVDQPERTSEIIKEISKNGFLTKDSPGG